MILSQADNQAKSLEYSLFQRSKNSFKTLFSLKVRDQEEVHSKIVKGLEEHGRIMAINFQSWLVTHPLTENPTNGEVDEAYDRFLLDPKYNL